MTDDIKLPPLPASLLDVETEVRAYASAAVEADRQRRGEPVAFLCRECDEEGWSTYVVMPHEVPSTGEFLHVEPLYASPVAAQAQPTMPPLTEAMRAVLRNENDVYGDEDALYTALCAAAQAQPDVSLTPVMQRESQRGAESGRDRDDAKCWPQCWCATCRPLTMSDSRMIVCPDCGDKRCPRAHDHRNACAARAAKGADHG